jgi:hypothetical protein
MDETNDRRREGRLSYHWLIWFSEDFSQKMSQGLMVDISSRGVAFTYDAEGDCLREGQPLNICFSIPRLDDEDPMSTVTITEPGHVRRIENVSDGLSRAAVQFDKPLALGPSEKTTLEIMRGEQPARQEHAIT